jgi:hypothetical protein
MSDIEVKRETLLIRRGHLIRILSLMLLFLSIVFFLIGNILIRGLLPESVGVIGAFGIYFLAVILVALVFSILASVILCLGALISYEFVLKNSKDALYNGDSIKNGIDEFTALREADELLKVYTDTEDRVFRIYIIWGSVSALFVIILLVLISVREMSKLEPIRRAANIIGVPDYLSEIFVLLLLLPIIVLLIYSIYVSYMSMRSRAGTFLKKKIKREAKSIVQPLT